MTIAVADGNDRRGKLFIVYCRLIFCWICNLCEACKLLSVRNAIGSLRAISHQRTREGTFCALGILPKRVSNMSKPVRGLLAIALCIGTFTPTLHAANASQDNGSSVFLMTNSSTRNEILTYQHSGDEQFFLANRVDTGGQGSGGLTDSLQSQGSLTLSDDHSLHFAVNSASRTVSSFHIVHGVPVLVDQESSEGASHLSSEGQIRLNSLIWINQYRIQYSQT